jgi:hypothetical protein
MFRCWSATFLYGLVLGASAGARPLLLTVRRFIYTPSSTNLLCIQPAEQAHGGDSDLSAPFSPVLVPRNGEVLKLTSDIAKDPLTRQHAEITRSIELFRFQGKRSKVFKVTPSWPCMVCNPPGVEQAPALAKKHNGPRIDENIKDRESAVYLERAGLFRVCTDGLTSTEFYY